MPAPKITVSPETFNEIMGELEKQGYKPGENIKSVELNLDQLKTFVDFRMATIRRDCANIIAQVWKPNNDATFLECAEGLYQYVLTGKLPTNKSTTNIKEGGE